MTAKARRVTGSLWRYERIEGAVLGVRVRILAVNDGWWWFAERFPYSAGALVKPLCERSRLTAMRRAEAAARKLVRR